MKRFLLELLKPFVQEQVKHLTSEQVKKDAEEAMRAVFEGVILPRIRRTIKEEFEMQRGMEERLAKLEAAFVEQGGVLYRTISKDLR